MMANRSADILYQLVCSLEKSEKRHFKLYIKRSSAKEDLKIIQLFDALDKLPEYDERLLLKKLPFVTKPQLSNLKTHLYKQLLASLRLLKTAENTDLQLSEHLDHARVLYNKGLKLQSLKILEKAKEIAKSNSKFNFLAQVISLEKKIETLHITRSSLEKTQLLAEEALDISGHISRVSQLSNLALLLYRWYVKNGHARNEQDKANIKEFFRNNLPKDAEMITDFYERLYLYQSYSWYAYIRQNFLAYYRYSQKWIDLFDKEPLMIAVETGHYVKGMHNLLNALFDLRHYEKFEFVLRKFEAYSRTPVSQQHDNFRIHTFVYINAAKINQHLMLGTFREGLAMIPDLEKQLDEYSIYIDRHRILVFNYKIANLYFGNGDYATSIDYLQKIIQDHLDLRYDLQCYARLLHLMAHYEMGNFEIIESLIKSVYRFMARMKNLTIVEEEMFRFLRKTFDISPRKLKPELISWLESKVHEKPMSQIIHEKYLKSRRMGKEMKIKELEIRN
jgi:hypothetical protein